ncbi:MAG TPA: TetR/AcrR family transcriptional regulator [Methanobacterium sp.]|nr:TetR/AcrR family transcriptional regulator [Methanobacterium sp.]
MVNQKNSSQRIKNKSGSSTKERIFDVSVDLFSKKGFNAVSIREIAREVGIRESSIYNHYKNKDAILDSVFQYFKEELIKMRPPEVRNQDTLENITPEVFRQRAHLTLNLFRNPKMEKLFRIISNEQFRDDRARNIVLNYLIREPCSFSKKALKIMINKGIITEIDPDIKAIEFQYTIFTLFMEYLLLRSESSDTRQVDDMIEKHLDHFINSLEKGR